MSIGKTYKEALQKSIRALEIGRSGLGFARDFHQLPLDELLSRLDRPSSERQFLMYEALRKGADIQALYEKTFIKPWFIQQMKELVEREEEILRYRGKDLPGDLLVQAKKEGFADRYLARLLGVSEKEIRDRRLALGMAAGFHAVRVSGVENAAYYYSSYNAPDCTPTSSRRKIMVLGGGPNRIGQGIEFDYCCVHAAFALKDAGVEAIMVNCNPETVSTDYDTSDRLYFEPLTVEDILNIYAKEKPEGIIVQFGGQTPLNLANELAEAGVKILGTSSETIELAEDRDRFRQRMREMGIPQPDSGMASNLEEALAVARQIGFPLIVRPSFVLGGRAMEIVHDRAMLERYLAAAIDVSPERPILIEKFLDNAIEAEADAIADGWDAFVPAVMEHIELAGIHSGDSACVIPPISIPPRHLETICEYTRKIAVTFEVVGLMNIQYAIWRDTVYILEANPRASRTVPLVSKVCNIPMATLGTRIMLGARLSDLGLQHKPIPHFGVKEAVFPFNMYHEVDPILGPEMRSTGEVLGMDSSFGLAYYKAQEGAQQRLPVEGAVLLTVSDADKPAVLEVARLFTDLKFRIRATRGTHALLAEHGIASDLILKRHEGHPNIVDALLNGEIQLVINTPKGKLEKADDAYIRTTAIKRKIPYITTLTAAIAAARGIAAFRQSRGQVRSLQEYHAAVR
jgi:carbamoyl-phosphate synthase large subunit